MIWIRPWLGSFLQSQRVARCEYVEWTPCVRPSGYNHTRKQRVQETGWLDVEEWLDSPLSLSYEIFLSEKSVMIDAEAKVKRDTYSIWVYLSLLSDTWLTMKTCWALIKFSHFCHFLCFLTLVFVFLNVHVSRTIPDLKCLCSLAWKNATQKLDYKWNLMRWRNFLRNSNWGKAKYCSHTQFSTIS